MYRVALYILFCQPRARIGDLVGWMNRDYTIDADRSTILRHLWAINVSVSVSRDTAPLTDMLTRLFIIGERR